MTRFVWLLFLPLSWVYAAWLYSVLPASVPVHWNAAGEVDRFGSRAEAALVLPVIMIFTAAVLMFAAYRMRAMGWVAGIILGFMFCVQLITGYAFQHGSLPDLVFGLNPLVAWLPLGLGWIYSIWLYSRLPGIVPLQWDLAGKVSSYGNRAVAAFLLPATFTLIAALMFAVARDAPVVLVTGLGLAMQIGMAQLYRDPPRAD